MRLQDNDNCLQRKCHRNLLLSLYPTNGFLIFLLLTSFEHSSVISMKAKERKLREPTDALDGKNFNTILLACCRNLEVIKEDVLDFKSTNGFHFDRLPEVDGNALKAWTPNSTGSSPRFSISFMKNGLSEAIQYRSK